MTSEDRFTHGREKKNDIDVLCHARWNEKGVSVEMFKTYKEDQKPGRLIFVMSKAEAMSLAIEILKEVSR